MDGGTLERQYTITPRGRLLFMGRLAEVESSRTHFEVLGLGLKGPIVGLGLEASSSRKLPCPRLEDSAIFEQLKFRWKMPKTSRKICEHLSCFPHLEHKHS